MPRSKRTGNGRNYVRRWVRRHQEQGSVENKAPAGQRCWLILSYNRYPIESYFFLDLWRQVKRVIKSKRHGSIRRAKRKLESEDIILSQGSIQMKILGLKRVKVQPKPKLSEAQMQKRIEFAEKKRARNYWRRVLFTDETLLFLEPPSTHVYISSGDSIPQIPRSKQSPKIMVWGGISWYGKTELILVAQGSQLIQSDIRKYYQELGQAFELNFQATSGGFCNKMVLSVTLPEAQCNGLRTRELKFFLTGQPILLT